MICGLPAISFVILCIVWPACPIASIICGVIQDKKTRKEEAEAGQTAEN
jgi:hypothetical protein